MNSHTRTWFITLLALSAVFFAPLLAAAQGYFSPRPPDPVPVERLDLPVPNYAWWYGCSPTSAGMLLGFYDRHYPAIGGLDRLLPGYLAPSENWEWTIFGWNADEDSPARFLINALRDTMHTTYPGGSTSRSDIPPGIRDLADIRNLGAIASLNYNFSWDNYVAEIRAGRPVLIHVSYPEGGGGHTMTGIGYDIREGRRNAVFHDTWDRDYHWMDWDGTYDGRERDAITTVRFLLPHLKFSELTESGAYTPTNVVDWGHQLVGPVVQHNQVRVENTGGMDYTPYDSTGQLQIEVNSPEGLGASVLDMSWPLQRGEVSPTDMLVHFTAYQRGPVSGEVTFDYGGWHGLSGLYTATLPMQANAVAPQGSFDGWINIGPVRLGTTAAVDATILNVGDGNLSGAPPELSNLQGSIGAVSGRYVGAGGVVDLADGLSESFEYLYTPVEHAIDVGVIPYEFENGSPDGANEPFDGSILVEGIGVGPVYESSLVVGSAIDLGEVRMGTSNQLPLQITNVSPIDFGVLPETDLTILDAVIGGPDGTSFSVADFTSGMVLHQSEAEDFLLEFAPPPSAGSKWATVTFVTDQGAALGMPGASFVYTLLGISLFNEADFDQDGDVDGDDFLTWQLAFPTLDGSGTPSTGDANDDGNVDGEDFLVWQTQFGRGLNGAGNLAIPEPTAAVLAFAVLGVASLRRFPSDWPG